MTAETITNGNGRSGVGFWQEALRTPWVMVLGALLLVQLLAALLLSLGGRGALDPTSLDQPLLTFDPPQITQVLVEAGDGTRVSLARSDDGWLLSDVGDFPADAPKVEQLLETLSAVKRPLPVATSTESLTRHRVADDGFERRVTLSTDDETVATLVLGDSPGFRRVLARPAGESAVYDIDLALFDASDRRDDWVARDALRIPQERIAGIAAGDWSLVKRETGWQLDGSDAEPDQSAVDDLLSRLSELGYRGVLGTEARPEYGQDAPTLELTLTLTEGEPRTYRVSKVADSDELVLKASDLPWYFKVSQYDIDGLAEMDRARLLGQPEGADEAASSLPEPAASATPAPPPAPAPGDEPEPASTPQTTAPSGSPSPPTTETEGSEQAPGSLEDGSPAAEQAVEGRAAAQDPQPSIPR